MITIQRNQSSQNDNGGNYGGGGTVPPAMPPDIPADPNDPLNAPRVERAYSTSPKDYPGTAPEPPATPPPDLPGMGETTGEDDDDESETSELPPEAKLRSAKDLAKYAVGTYGEYVPIIFRSIASVSQRKLDDMSIKGEVDFNLKLEFADNTIKTAGEYVTDTNESIQHQFGVSEQFKADVIPVLTKYFKEKSWGLTTAEQLMLMFGKDLMEKAWQAIAIKNQLSATLDFLKEQTKMKSAAASAGAAGVTHGEQDGQQPSGSVSTAGRSSNPAGGSSGSRKPDENGVITIPPNEVETLPPTELD